MKSQTISATFFISATYKTFPLYRRARPAFEPSTRLCLYASICLCVCVSRRLSGVEANLSWQTFIAHSLQKPATLIPHNYPSSSSNSTPFAAFCLLPRPTQNLTPLFISHFPLLLASSFRFPYFPALLYRSPLRLCFSPPFTSPSFLHFLSYRLFSSLSPPTLSFHTSSVAVRVRAILWVVCM